jgi:hypothetical protein
MITGNNTINNYQTTMKKQLLTAALICASLPLLAQQSKADTAELRQEIKTLSLAANIIAKRTDVSVSQALPALTLINQIIQADMAEYEAVKRNSKVMGKKP